MSDEAINNADDRLMAAAIRSLQFEVRAGFDLLGNRLLTMIDGHDKRIATLETLLSKALKRQTRRRKKKK